MSNMMTMPTVINHKIKSGGDLSGVAPDGTDSEETFYRGRYRVYTDCDAAGLISPDPSLNTGYKVERASWNLTGLTGVNFYLVDPDGLSYLVGGDTGAAGYFDWRNDGILVPPTFGFKAVSQGGTLSAAGGVVFILGKGWGHAPFENVTTLGRQAYPPSQY